MNSDLKKQAQALEATFLRKTKSNHSQTCFSKILGIYLNEKLNFYHHIIERNTQMQDQKICFIRLIFLLILKYNGNHQYNT